MLRKETHMQLITQVDRPRGQALSALICNSKAEFCIYNAITSSCSHYTE